MAVNPFGDKQERLEQDAVAWLVRLNSGDATDADRQAVDMWRRLSLAHDQAFHNAERLWRGIEPLRHHLPVAGRKAPADSSSAKRERRRRSWMPWGAVAAALGGLAIVLTLVSGALSLHMADARTGTGEQVTLPLNDGSQVLLNTQTAVAIHYSAAVRRVELKAGEAAFRVAKDAGRPFIVQAQGGQIRAVGTEFIVHETEQAVLVTVTEGAVDVSAPGDQMDSSTRVHAGQRVRYSASGVIEVEPVDLRAATAWQRGKLIFESTPLATVVDEINRYRPGRVVLLSTRLADHQVSGVFDLTRLDTAVESIEQTLPVTTVRFTSRLVLFR